MRKDSGHQRRSIRLKGYDYAQAGAYFITLCTQDRVSLFGEVVEGEMRLNDAGRTVEWTWQDLPNHLPQVTLDAFVVMPKHVHGIIIISDDLGTDSLGMGIVGADIVGAGSEPAPAKRYALPEIVRQLKTFSARRINQLRLTHGTPVWQRNYYEHIIRNEESLHRIRQYIADNPAQWAFDRENPDAVAPTPVANLQGHSR